MASKGSHTWAFKPGMRAGGFGWRGSAKAVQRLKAARTEIRAVNRTDPVAAAECAVALAERIWPAFAQIDTSSGALGGAARRTLQDLVPLLIAAPADQPTRAKWLERLRTAIVEDGVDYLAPISERFGEIAVWHDLMISHAERDLDLVREAWADHARFSLVPTTMLTLSCLLEAGEYDRLRALLALRATRLWAYDRYGAEALLRQGRETEALAEAVALLETKREGWDHCDICRFCETILIRQGRTEEAYRRFGLPAAAGSTWLGLWRDLVKRYPERDGRGMLEDLIALHGRKGKWFAAAKTAGQFDIALDCATDPEAAPATLIRAARDFAVKEPAFAARVAVLALDHLLAGRAYDASLRDVDAAVAALMTASGKLDRIPWAIAEMRRLAREERGDQLMRHRLRFKLAEVEA